MDTCSSRSSARALEGARAPQAGERVTLRRLQRSTQEGRAEHPWTRAERERDISKGSRGWARALAAVWCPMRGRERRRAQIGGWDGVVLMSGARRANFGAGGTRACGPASSCLRLSPHSPLAGLLISCGRSWLAADPAHKSRPKGF